MQKLIPARHLVRHIRPIAPGKHASWTRPMLPWRGDMAGAVATIDTYRGSAKVDIRHSAAYQRAWVRRERSIPGTALNLAWRKCVLEHTFESLLEYEAQVDRLAPPLDTQEYAPDTTREIQRDYHAATAHSRTDRTATDRLPARYTRPDSDTESWDDEDGKWRKALKPGGFYLPEGASSEHTLGESTRLALRGKVAGVSREQAWDTVMHCVTMADDGDIAALGTILVASRSVLQAIGAWNGTVTTVCKSLPSGDARRLGKLLRKAA